MRYASCGDRLLLYIGSFSAFCMGGALPGFSLFFGDMVDNMGSISFDPTAFDSLKNTTKIMLILASALFVVSWIQVSFFSVFAENISHKIRIQYYKKCLDLDASYYDEHNPNEMTSKIVKETDAINKGVGSKVGQVILSVASFFMGFIFAFYWGYHLTLLLLACIPFMGLIGGVFGTLMQTGIRELINSYAQAGGYAEQALASIKVVHTYGQELLERNLYEKYVLRSKEIHAKVIFKFSLTGSMFFFLIFFFYAYSFFMGGMLRWKNADAAQGQYTAGTTLAIMFSVVFGAMQLGGVVNHLRSLSEAKIAGKLAFEVIDHDPLVKVNEPGKK